jgi:hypothetical protein
MSEGGKPCCAAAAAARLRYLVVGGHRIAIAQLDEILEKAKAVASEGDGAVRKELVRLVKAYNYVPPPAEKIYEDALFAEYMAPDGQGQGRGGKEPEGNRGEGKGK